MQITPKRRTQSTPVEYSTPEYYTGVLRTTTLGLYSPVLVSDYFTQDFRLLVTHLDTTLCTK
jgi:hypothetical protein